MEKFKKEWEENKKNLKNGPPQERSITDCLCCFIFIVFMLGMGAVFGYGLYYERLSHITIGWDSDGNGCGYSPGFEDYNYLYFGTAPTKEEFDALTKGSLNLIEKRNAVFGLLEAGVCVK